MASNFNIIKSEFISTDFPRDDKYIHWSRIYEWKYAIDAINEYKPETIHNTACGGLNTGDCLHLTFCKDILDICKSVINSDIWGTDYPGVKTKPEVDNFIYYDITEPYDKQFDMVLNISTIEHLPKDKIVLTLDNILNQVKQGGHLILTFDYPEIDLATIKQYFNVEITQPHNNITNGRLSVVLIHLIKL